MAPCPDECVVRPLAAADAPQLAGFLPAALGGAWTAQDILELPGKGHLVRVLVGAAASGPRVVGFAECLRVVDEAELLALAIAPVCRGRGFGQWLLAQVLAELREAGCRRCLLEVRRSNEAAQRLYCKAGFVPEGVRKAYYPPLQTGGEPEDALLYSCLLVSS